MRRLVSFTLGFTAAIAILLRAHEGHRVVLVSAAGTTAVLLFILYLKRYFKISSLNSIKANYVPGHIQRQKRYPKLYRKRLHLTTRHIKSNGRNSSDDGSDKKKEDNKQKGCKRSLIILIGFLVGALWLILFEVVKYTPAIDLIGTESEESFVVLDYPRQYGISSRVFVKTSSGHKANLRLFESIDLKPGDKLTMSVQFSAPQATRDFDFLTYYRAKGIFIDAEQTGEIEIEYSKSFPVKYLPLLVRKAISEKLASLFNGTELGFVKALLTGDKSDLPQSAQFTLSSAGMAHIISVSGMHVVFLVGMVLFVFRRQKVATIVALPLMLFFVLMTGAAPSSIRAFVMQSIILLARIVGREEDSLTSLSTAMLILLIINPFCIMDIGLQLSFLATLGMILFSPRIQIKIYSLLPSKHRKNPAVKFIVSTLCATLSANVLTLFPVLWYFGRLPLISPISNLLSLWMVSLAFYMCTICVLLSFICIPIAEVIAVPLRLGVKYINCVASLSIRLPFAVLDVRNPFILIWIVFTVIVTALWILERKNRSITYVAVSVVVITLSCAVIFSELDMLDSDMTITVLDVGQGQSIIATSGAYTVLIDCGGNRYPGAGNIAAEYLLNHNKHKIDMIILTHTHSDHINGIKELLDNVNIKCAALPDTIAALETADYFTQRGIKVLAVDDNHLIDMAKCNIKIFRPIVKKSNDEETMCVMISAGEFNALVTGDAAFISEKILTEREVLPDIELLVAGHHGSSKSTGEALLDASSPEVAVISTGQNSYGHPSAETLQRLKDRGIDIYRTDRQGMIEIKVKSWGDMNGN
jgi:competence protein ComEC